MNKTEDINLWDLFNPFGFDRDFYNFNREEKDMHPYSILNNEKEKKITLTHNVLGINKEDIKLTRRIEDRVTYIVISGKSKDEITGKEYSINSRFGVDANSLDLTKVRSTMKNGLLYITIPYKEVKHQERESIINID